jgi:phospholipid transport system substrate-binding protein
VGEILAWCFCGTERWLQVFRQTQDISGEKLMRIRGNITGLQSGLLVCFLFISVSSLWAAPAIQPSEVIKTGTDKMLQVLDESRKEGAPTLKQRRDEIFTILDKYFSFGEMARRALGRPWKDQTPEKRQEFVRLFKQLLFNTYVDRVEGYTGSQGKIIYAGEKTEGEYAIVHTKITGYKNTDVVVDYRLKVDGTDWKVYDVIVEGVSFVDNYREQFSAILANESFDSLLNKLREKAIGIQSKS